MRGFLVSLDFHLIAAIVAVIVVGTILLRGVLI